MDMSLDEIIKKKKISPASSSSSRGIKPKTKTLSGRIGKTRTVIDARNKIIQSKRSKIRDAREKIRIKDARQKIKQRSSDLMTSGIKTSVLRRNSQARNTKPTLPGANLYGAPRGYVDYDNMELLEEEYDPSNFTLRRTVYNDMVPNFSHHPDNYSMNHDPFEVYDIPMSRYRDYDIPPAAQEPVNIRRKIRNVSPDVEYIPPPRKGILRDVSPIYQGKFNAEQSNLSYEMRSRLERAPDPHASMGIFANPLKSQHHQLLPQSYRIVVSNLHPSVSQSDIQELFEDIGDLHEARLVKPGVAEVIFKNIKDAEKAVDTYHNRQLDGQPMKCLLVNPRASNKPTAPALKVSASSQPGKTPLEIDIDALHKVLFRRN